jgi:ADP-heptose:LPS heptosyltransferase
MHLASTMGTPCVCVFSARGLPGVWFPRGANNIVIRHEVSCANCGLESCFDEKRRCIESVTVDEMMQAVEKQLDVGVRV